MDKLTHLPRHRHTDQTRENVKSILDALPPKKASNYIVSWANELLNYQIIGKKAVKTAKDAICDVFAEEFRKINPSSNKNQRKLLEPDLFYPENWDAEISQVFQIQEDARKAINHVIQTISYGSLQSQIVETTMSKRYKVLMKANAYFSSKAFKNVNAGGFMESNAIFWDFFYLYGLETKYEHEYLDHPISIKILGTTYMLILNNTTPPAKQGVNFITFYQLRKYPIQSFHIPSFYCAPLLYPPQIWERISKHYGSQTPPFSWKFNPLSDITINGKRYPLAAWIDDTADTPPMKIPLNFADAIKRSLTLRNKPIDFAITPNEPLDDLIFPIGQLIIKYPFDNKEYCFNVRYITNAVSSVGGITISLQNESDIALYLSREVRDNFLMRHNLLAKIDPASRIEEYDGSRGKLDLEDTLKRTASEGQLSIRQRYKARIKDQPCYLFTMTDISGSMGGHIVKTFFLVSCIFSLFENRFKEAVMSFIKEGSSYTYHTLADKDIQRMDDELLQKYSRQMESIHAEYIRSAELIDQLQKELEIHKNNAPLNQDKGIKDAHLAREKFLRNEIAKKTYFQPSLQALQYFNFDKKRFRILTFTAINNAPPAIFSTFKKWALSQRYAAKIDLDQAFAMILKTSDIEKFHEGAIREISRLKLDQHVLIAEKFGLRGTPMSRMFGEFNNLSQYYFELWNSFGSGSTEFRGLEDFATHRLTKLTGLKYFIITTDAGLSEGGGERAYNIHTKRYEMMGGLLGMTRWLEVLSARQDTRLLLILVGMNIPVFFEEMGVRFDFHTRSGDPFLDIPKALIHNIIEQFENELDNNALEELEIAHQNGELTEYEYITQKESIYNQYPKNNQLQFFRWWLANFDSVFYTSTEIMNSHSFIEIALEKLLRQKFYIKIMK